MTVKENLITRMRRALASADEPGRLIIPASGQNASWLWPVLAAAAVVPGA